MSAQPTVRTPHDVKQLGTIMGVWAHPDDESFTCGGLLAAAMSNGQKVVCVTATKGEAGVRDAKRWPPEKLGDIRAAELAAALQVIGVNDHHWLGYADGNCSQVNEEGAVMQLMELLRTYRPDTILTFGPDGMTGHPDHQTVSHWASSAVGRLELDTAIYHAVQSRQCYEECLKTIDEKFNIFYNIDEPPLRDEKDCAIYFHLPSELFTQKIKALAVMPSQTEAMFQAFSPEEFRAAFGLECFSTA